MSNIAAGIISEIRGKPEWAGAGIAARHRHGITLQHPTDTNRRFTVSTITPVHLPDETTEINTDFVAATVQPWLWQIGPADYKFYFGPGTTDFDAGMPFRYEAATGEYMQWQPSPGLNWINTNEAIDQIGSVQGVAGAVAGDEVYFSNAYGLGIDYKLAMRPGGVKKTLILNSPPPTPDPALTTQPTYLSFSVLFQRSSGVTVWVDGQQWNEGQGVANAAKTINSVEFRNAANEPIFYITRPYARDIDSVLEGTLRVRRQGGTYFIEMRFPYQWFFEPERIYPIEIDPTVNPQIGANDDDANETTAGLVATGANQRLNSSFPYVGYRLTAAVPNGATTNDCYWEIYGDHPSLTSFDASNWDFCAEDSCAAWDFSPASYDLSTRTLTGNGVSTSITLSISAFTSTASNTAAADAIWARGSWSSGNYVGAVFTWNSTAGTGAAQFKTYDEDTSLAPKLYVDYSTGGGGISIPVVMHHRRQTGQS